VTRDPQGKQRWVTLGPADRLPIKEARERARLVIERVNTGLPPIPPRAQNFGDVVGDWGKRHVEKNRLRTAYEINRLLDKHILPTWRDREFVAVRKSDIAELLDQIEDAAGARQADWCLDIIRSIMNWYAARHDDYSPPMTKGMRRQSTHAQRRARILDDEELRAIWQAAEGQGTFGAFVQILLLTAQRREKVLTMKWADVGEGGVWTIPAEAREKQNAGLLVLPETARAIIAAQPRFVSNDFVFASGRTAGPINGQSKFKERLDKAAGVSGWQIHDLRRTARSLMSRAGVSSEHAERVMGHAIAGVEGVYDHHSYKSEKAAALARLATLIDGIVHPRDHVMVMERVRR
jgi:integrase